MHRDVKPANILLEEGTGRVKLTDFGLARAADDASLSTSGTISGTPLFMAPEQARGDSFDSRADLFSLGTVLYCLCTGESPFQAPSMPAVLRRISDEEPEPLRKAAPHVPPWLEGMIAYLHAKDPAQRPSSAGEVARLLQAYLEHRARPDDLPPPPLPHLPRPRQAAGRARARFVFPAVAVMALTGLGAFGWIHRQSPQPPVVTRAPVTLRHLTMVPAPCPPCTASISHSATVCTDLERELRKRSEKEIRQVISQLLQMAEQWIKEAKRRGLANVQTTPNELSERCEAADCTLPAARCERSSQP